MKIYSGFCSKEPKALSSFQDIFLFLNSLFVMITWRKKIDTTEGVKWVKNKYIYIYIKEKN